MYERLAILVFTTAANLVLAVLVWVKNTQQRVSQYFALFSLSVASWTLSNGLVAAYADTQWGIVWARAAFVSASIIPLSFFLFVSVFPVAQPRPPRRVTRVLIGAGLVACLISLTPLIAAGTSGVNGILKMSYGPLHPIFGVYLVSTLGYSLYLLYKKALILSGIERLQVRYIFIAVSLPLLGGTITNLLIPIALNSSRFSQYGPLFSIPMIAVIAHAIIRHRLLNTRLVIRRGVAYLLTISAAAAAFSFLLNLLSGTFVSRPQEVPLFLEVLLGLFIAIAFQPLLRNVQGWLDRYLFRERYDYQRTVREISRTMASILDLQPLLAYACDAITKTVQPEHVTVYTTERAAGELRRLVTHTTIASLRPSPTELIPATSPLVSRLSRDQRLLITHEVRRGIAAPGQETLIDELLRLQADVVLPLIQDGDLKGLFAIGRKLSGDPYFADDIDLLTTLLSQATIALKNAQLYSQVVLANEYIENILTTIESGVVAVDALGQITLFNAAAERLTGLSSLAVKTTSLSQLPSTLGDLLAGTLSDGLPRTQVETIIPSTSGVLTSVICSTSALLNRNGTMHGAVAVFSDLTRLKTLEDEKRQAERLASIGALASGIAHEIKNPLVAIRTFAELLPERFTEEDFRNDFAKVVITEIDRIDGLVARLRGFATPSAQSLVPIDIRVPIEDTLVLLRGQLEQSQLSVALDFPDDLPPIAGDLSQLKQLFLNLFINAIEAMRPGDEISVRALLRGGQSGRTIHVQVSDTGTGIPNDLLGQIFDPFVTTKKSGSGLGLSISRGIADAHRATIRAENNRRGRGATIFMDFPVLETAAVEVRPFR